MGSVCSTSLAEKMVQNCSLWAQMVAKSVGKKACPNFGQMLLGHRRLKEFTSSTIREMVLRFLF